MTAGRSPLRRPWWLVSVALSFVDERVITSQGGIYLAGAGAAVLLGNARNDVQARIGLAIVIGGAVVVVYNDPSLPAGSLRLHTAVVHDRVARRLRTSRAHSADRGRGGAGRAGPSAIGLAGADGRCRGTSADRARAR